MNAEKIDIPEELEVLNPELQKKAVLVGPDAYLIYPLTEGQTERVSKLISDIMTDITTTDMQCPTCKTIYPNELGKQERCAKCPKKPMLASLQRPPVEALTFQDRVPRLVEEIVGIPVSKVKESLTIPQLKHLAGVLYTQNFKEEGVVPEDSRKNFQALLDWVGLGAEKEMLEMVPPENMVGSEKFTKPSPTNMDSQENTSKESGEREKMATENS